MSSPQRLRSSRDGNVYCIACGQVVAAADAYDYRHGDARDSEADMESLCGSCYQEYLRLPRDGLEETLVDAGAGRVDDQTFFQQYFQRITE